MSTLSDLPTQPPRKRGAQGAARGDNKEAPKAKAASEQSPKTSWLTLNLLLEVIALSLLIAAAVGLAALVGDFASNGQSNFLGPYLGSWYAGNLRRAFGKLPVLLVLIWTIVASLRMLGVKPSQWSDRYLWQSGLFLLLLSVLLSVGMIDRHQRTLEDFENTGGLFANFLVDSVLLPVAGPSSVAAYLIVSLGIFSLGMVALQLTPKALFFNVREAMMQLWAGRLSPDADSTDEPELKPHEQLLRRKQLERKAPKTPTATEIPVDAGDILDEDLSLPEPPEHLLRNPKELRRWRDQMAELERDRRVNEWEDQYGGGNPQIAGIVGETYEAPPRPKTAAKIPVALGPATRQMPKVDAQESPKAAPRRAVYDAYEIPAVGAVFPLMPEQPMDLTPEHLREQAAHLEAQLANFGVKGKVSHITTGPVITRFEIDLAPGVKVSKVANLGDDLALALRAKSVRVLAPIPGKSAVGIEIPNPRSQIVYCRDVLQSEIFNCAEDQILIGLGKDIAGRPFVMDLARAPHLLIAGQTGSGKSVCINMLMASLLCSKSPDDLRLLLVDPKVVELKPYEKIPHLLAPVITQPDVAVQALKWACYEMDRRYEVLAKARVRNIAGFNQKIHENQLMDLVDAEDNVRMPYLVIIIDEFADLMMVAGKEVEMSVARIAQKARAVGIHLVLATQRPSTNVITGTIKANLPSRIAFMVASQIDARTIMDKAGSEKLLGRGDMLFRAVDDPEPHRVHGAYLSDAEVEVLANACSSQNVLYPQLTSFDLEEAHDGDYEREAGPRDDKFAEAAWMVVTVGQASTSMLQRRMQLGYARAGRIMDQLEAAGIVGRDRGGKGREILMDELELQSFLGGSTQDFDP
jgi:DNA segregation ATPase FtsK/SpoIIIE-like protein